MTVSSESERRMVYIKALCEQLGVDRRRVMQMELEFNAEGVPDTSLSSYAKRHGIAVRGRKDQIRLQFERGRQCSTRPPSPATSSTAGTRT